ncbi:amino acid--tRNA ligase-related protein, partial [Devosia chinhatensis]
MIRRSPDESTQGVNDPDAAAFPMADKGRAELVLPMDGEANLREASAVNSNIPTGAIEISSLAIEVRSAAKELTLPVFGDADYPEDIRLRYRFLALRREKLHNNILKRTKIISALRAGMRGAGLTELSTPILPPSSPEAAPRLPVPATLH